MKRLHNRVALVTGGRRGIGKGIVLSFAAEGADVIFTCRSGDRVAEETVKEAEKYGVSVSYIKADGRKEEEVIRVRDFVKSRYGRINILVNNAGIIGERVRITDMDAAEFDDVIATNLRSTFLYSKYFIPLIAKDPVGKIINLSSEISKIGLPEYAQYGASKGAINVFSMCMALELAPDILVNCVAPGPTLTDMTIEDSKDPEYMKFIRQDYPLQRLAEVREITGIIVLLASDEGNYFCGQCIGPNGGASFL